MRIVWQVQSFRVDEDRSRLEEGSAMLREVSGSFARIPLEHASVYTERVAPSSRETLIRRDRNAQAEAEIARRLGEGLKSPRSRIAEKTFFKRMHTLIDQIAEQGRSKGRNGKATRSTSRD